MAESKQRLRPWLEGQINSGKIPGLHWLNTQKTKFRIPWSHSGKQDWDPETSKIFKEWAIHTGRYRPNIEPEDYVTWKTRLRCALNKAPDMLYIKEESEPDSLTDAFRVYELLKKKDRRQAAMYHEKDESCPNSPLTIQQVISVCPSPADAQGAPIPTFLDDFTASSGDAHVSSVKMESIKQSLPEDLKSVEPMIISGPSITNKLPLEDVCNTLDSIKIANPEEGASEQTYGAGSETGQDIVQISSDTEDEMEVKIYYSGVAYVEKRIKVSTSCRLCYGVSDVPLVDLSETPWMQSMVFGGTYVEPIYFPPCDGLFRDVQHEKYCQKVLESGMGGGIYLKSYDDDIYTYRNCKCSVFYISSEVTNGQPVKLYRDTENDGLMGPVTKVFDFQKFFRALHAYMEGSGPKPNPVVYLLLGAQKTLFDVQKGSVLMYVTVVSRKARNLLEQVEAQSVQPTLEQAEEYLQLYDGSTPVSDASLNLPLAATSTPASASALLCTPASTSNMDNVNAYFTQNSSNSNLGSETEFNYPTQNFGEQIHFGYTTAYSESDSNFTAGWDTDELVGVDTSNPWAGLVEGIPSNEAGGEELGGQFNGVNCDNFVAVYGGQSDEDMLKNIFQVAEELQTRQDRDLLT